MIALAICEIGSLAERRIAHAGRSGALRPAGVPDPDAGPQLRLHDPAGDRGGARFREQAARLSRRASIRSRPRPTRRTTCRWRRTARAGLPPMAENAVADRRHRAPGGRAGLRLSRAASSSAPLEARARACCAQRSRTSTTTAISIPTSQAAIELVRGGRDRSKRPAKRCCRASRRRHERRRVPTG